MSNYNPFSLVGKTILITGASSGIGQATAIECSQLGAKLVVTGRDAARLQATFNQLDGDGHRQVVADLTADADLAKLVEACPGLNGVALCAGVSKPLPFSLCKKEKFSSAFDVNFFAPMELLRLLMKARKLADASSVVFVSSVAASSGGAAAGNTIYGASKAALSAAMRHLALEFSPRRIRVNSVNPGAVNTPLTERIYEKMTEEQIAADIARYPLGRHGEPNDIAHGIVYLLSDAASWVTGQQLIIDGGLTVL